MKAKTVDGVTYVNTHSGQKRAYGDTYYEYEVASDLPKEEVEQHHVQSHGDQHTGDGTYSIHSRAS